MSAWVVTPTGVVIEYANCQRLAPQVNGDVWLYGPDKGGKIGDFLAITPRGSAVSYTMPKAVAMNGSVVDAAVRIVAACAESATDRHRLKDLKLKLRRFNARTRQWRS